MITIQCFTFNPFQENTYILHDESRESLIIDPGCYHVNEQNKLINYIEDAQLKPVRLINTHCHIDHVLGNRFIAETYNLNLEIHKNETDMLLAIKEYAPLYSIDYRESPLPKSYLKENDEIQFGHSNLNILSVPGHSVGHIALASNHQKFVISGDVLFQGSIGRTDLPGGDYAALIHSIKSKLIPLGDDFQVYPGHGPSTNIGFERANNPFLVTPNE